MTLPIVKRYLIAFDQYKWVGLITFCVSVGVAGVVAKQPGPAPTYTVTGTLAYRRPPVIFSTTGTKIQQEGQELTKELLLDQRVIEEAATQVKLSPKKLEKNLVVKMPKGNDNSGPIQISYKHIDRERGEFIVNTVMAEMVKQSQLINSARLRETINQINNRLPAITQELRTAEQKLENYEKRESVAILNAQSGILPQAITSNQQQQRQARVQLDTVNTQIRGLESRLGLTANQAFVAQALASDPIIAQLRIQLYSAESQLEVFRKDFRDEHPKIVELLKQKQAFEAQLRQRATEVLGGNGTAAPLRDAGQIRVDSALDPARQQLAQLLISLQTQQEGLQQQLLSLMKTEQELRQIHATIPNKQLEQTRLSQQVLLKKTLYDKMQSALVDAQAAMAETTGSLVVAQIAKAGNVESNRKSLSVMLAVGGFMGVLLGGGLIFVLGMLNGKFYSWEEVRSALQEREVPLLGLLPLAVVFDPDSEEMPLALEANSPYLPYWERFRSNLRRVGGKNLKVVLLTSPANSEGKTFSAYNLAIASARAGKRTLLLEADLRSPSQVKSLRIAPDPASTVEPLRYYGDLGECVRPVPDVENLYIVPSAGPLRYAAAVLESSEVRHLLEDVRSRFDFVVLDAPALSESSDALTLEPYTDGMILVARPGYTLASTLAEAMEQLANDEEEEAGDSLRLLGAIINGADIPVAFHNEAEDFDLPLQALIDPSLDLPPKRLSHSPKVNSKMRHR